MRSNWEILISKCMSYNGEVWGDLISTTLSKRELLEPFDPGFGASQGKPFTAWTENFVYFPCTYDGMEWVESVPRNPCDTATSHIGGE